jgi:hypothetical protein
VDDASFTSRREVNSQYDIVDVNENAHAVGEVSFTSR